MELIFNDKCCFQFFSLCLNSKLTNFLGELKVLQYFSNVRYNSVALSAKFINVTNHTGLWDANLIRYFLNATWQICLYGFEHSLGFRPTWPCPVLQGSCNLSEISRNILLPYYDPPLLCLHLSHNKCVWFLPWHKELISEFDIHLWGFQTTHWVKQCTMCLWIITILRTSMSTYHSLNSFSYNICTAKLHILKYCKIFDSP